MIKRIVPVALGMLAIADAVAIDLNVTPGSLAGQIENLSSSETVVRLTGSADARDLSLLGKLPANIRLIDLSGVSVKEISASKPIINGRTWFSENELPEFTFFHSNATEVILPKDVKRVGEGAFSGSRISTVVIPAGVTSIGDYAFFGCSSLTSVTLPETLTSIGKEAFGKCTTLKKIDFSDTKITEIPDRAFAGCGSLATVLLPGCIRVLGNEAFSGTDIESLSLTGVVTIGDYALSDMPSLREVTLNPSANMGTGILMDNPSLRTIKSTPDEIPGFFAANCPELDAKDIVSVASTIGDYALANNKVSEIVLTRGLRHFHKGAMANCNNLSRIMATDLTSDIPDADPGAFEGINPSKVELQVNMEIENLWKNHPVWKMFNIVGNSSTDSQSLLDKNHVILRTEGNELIAEAEGEILKIAVYNAAGETLLTASPASSTFRSAVNASEGEILIVAVLTEAGEKTFKVIF